MVGYQYGYVPFNSIIYKKSFCGGQIYGVNGVATKVNRFRSLSVIGGGVITGFTMFLSLSMQFIGVVYYRFITQLTLSYTSPL